MIRNYSNRSEIDKFDGLIKDLYDFCKKKLSFDEDIKQIAYISNTENAKNPLGKTAFYIPSTKEIAIFVDDRHIKDIMRSISHELVHHKQNCKGELDNLSNTELGYAQEDSGKEIEKEAYMRGNLIFREWEDKLKQERETEQIQEHKSKKFKERFNFDFKPY